MFRYVVLGLLRDGVPRHGYALMKEHRERSGVRISTGNFYRELQHLAAEGLVRAVTNAGDHDPRRAPYAITETGAAVFDDWLTRPNGAGIAEYADELSLRVEFITEADAAVKTRALERWQDELLLCGKTIERAHEGALGRCRNGGRRAHAARAVSLARRFKHVSAELEFLEELRAAERAGTTLTLAGIQAHPRLAAAPQVAPPLAQRRARAAHK
jgi:DNA-binding PadR family transcriptional regulator